jgi:phosphoglycolate phosphatase
VIPARLPRPPRAILFDLDGVLVDTREIWTAVLDDCRKARGLPALDRAAVDAAWGQSLSADCARLFPGADPRELALEYGRVFERFLPRLTPVPGVVPLLAGLERGAIPRAVVTNTPHELARRMLAAAGLTRWLPVVAGSDEVEMGKPDPALLHLALSRLGLDTRDVVFVGDTWNDREAGRAAGIPVVGVRLDAEARIEALPELAPLLGIL